MNNAQIIRARTTEEAIDKAVVGSDAIAIATTLKHLSSLRGTIHFRNYINSFIVPEVSKKAKALKSEKELSEIRYIQGYIAGLEKFMDTEHFERIYKLKLEQYGKGTNRKNGQ